ncbi:hypothetical protein CQY20_30125 [Mycolicibacterium agri]|uniref:Uncharacterized protein n=1 Tax=Mycolicibacterium agri TaxID=36811 RepID=A0A2A7MQG4_MYCAG|nr:hypothetical protein [Mycolicibacterium agri]PEG33571.1 hypothetical protein CQY20_30125 [Mycolicibacterium agri]GFG50778.1 hypothetical protein MAGR_22190 [Mycolicibacterium agri]
MSADARFALPGKLPALVQLYTDKVHAPVRFRLPSWETALAGIPGQPTRLLCDPAVTTEPSTERFRSRGDRLVSRKAVIDVCASTDFADDEAVLAAFVLVMAWGSGTSNSRSLRYTRKALADISAAAVTLRQSAVALRSVERVDDPDIATIHRSFRMPGVGEAFFTKWFAFAGFVSGREWQPLILDSRVRNTLHTTLDVWLNQLTATHRDPERYVAYLTAMHRWAVSLPQPMTATQLEWIMFTHNGHAV